MQPLISNLQSATKYKVIDKLHSHGSICNGCQKKKSEFFGNSVEYSAVLNAIERFKGLRPFLSIKWLTKLTQRIGQLQYPALFVLNLQHYQW